MAKFFLKFRCQVLEVTAPWGPTRHLKVERDDGKDRITWDELQRLKDKYLGQEVAAIEFYPPSDNMVNEINMRHLWEVPPEWCPLHRR
jgi:hypothetical protein